MKNSEQGVWMRYILIMFIVCAAASAIVITDYLPKDLDEGKVGVIIHTDAPYRGNITQKTEMDSLIFTFDAETGLNTTTDYQNNLITQLTLAPINDKTSQLIIKSRHQIEAAAEVRDEGVLITITTISAPITMEAIATDASGGIVGKLLDAAWYVVGALIFVLIIATAYVKYRAHKIRKTLATIKAEEQVGLARDEVRYMIHDDLAEKFRDDSAAQMRQRLREEMRAKEPKKTEAEEKPTPSEPEMQEKPEKSKKKHKKEKKQSKNDKQHAKKAKKSEQKSLFDL
jgi:hypothetical protein